MDSLLCPSMVALDVPRRRATGQLSCAAGHDQAGEHHPSLYSRRAERGCTFHLAAREGKGCGHYRSLLVIQGALTFRLTRATLTHPSRSTLSSSSIPTPSTSEKALTDHYHSPAALKARATLPFVPTPTKHSLATLPTKRWKTSTAYPYSNIQSAAVPATDTVEAGRIIHPLPTLSARQDEQLARRVIITLRREVEALGARAIGQGGSMRRTIRGCCLMRTRRPMLDRQAQGVIRSSAQIAARLGRAMRKGRSVWANVSNLIA